MINKPLKIFIIATAVMYALFLIATVMLMSDKISDRDLVIHSLNAEKDSINGHAKTLKLSHRQLLEYESELVDSIEKLGIKVRDLERVSQVSIRTEVKYVPRVFRDTVIEFRDSAAVSGKAIVVDSGCVRSVVFAPDYLDSIYVSQYCVVNGMLIIHKGKRIRQHYLFGWKRLPIFRLGPKSQDATFETDCPGAEVYISDIEITND